MGHCEIRSLDLTQGEDSNLGAYKWEITLHTRNLSQHIDTTLMQTFPVQIHKKHHSHTDLTTQSVIIIMPRCLVYILISLLTSLGLLYSSICSITINVILAWEDLERSIRLFTGKFLITRQLIIGTHNPRDICISIKGWLYTVIIRSLLPYSSESRTLAIKDVL